MPASTPDQSDLEQLARSGSRDALGRLVSRHLDFVYGVAGRAVGGDLHLAEDVAQAVFLVLRRRAGRIRPAHLCSWLFTTTRNVAANALKGAARRRYHELRAAAMSKETIMPCDTGDEHLQQHLQLALAAQRESDRAIVLMRYVQGMEINAISQTLGLSEGTARKRLERAIERLRENLNRRGITAGSVAIGAALSGVAEAAPPALPAAIVGTGAAAASGAAGSGAAMMLAKSAIFWTQIHAAAVFIISLGLVSGVTAAIWRIAARQPLASAMLAVEAPATAPATAPSAVYSGTVTDTEGKPLAAVRVWSALRAGDPSKERPVEAETTTDAQGRYALAPLPALESFTGAGRYNWFERSILFDHPDHAIFWARVRPESQRSRGPEVPFWRAPRLERGADLRVKVVDSEGKPLAGAQVSLDLQGRFPVEGGTIFYEYLTLPMDSSKRVLTDAQGIATFGRIPPSARAHVSVLATDFARFDSQQFHRQSTYLVRPGGSPFVAALRPGGQIRLRAAPGSPALPRGAEVLAFPISRFNLSSTSNWVSVELDGSYVLTGLEPGAYELMINPFGAGPHNGVWTVPAIVSVDPKQTADAIAEHGPGRIVSGRAVDAAGQPVQGHWIRLTHMLHGQQVSFDRVASGADGRFQFISKGGEHTVVGENYQGGGSSAPVNVPFVDQREPVTVGDLPVVPFPIVQGRLLDPSGRPIVGRVYLGTDTHATAADGSFRFTLQSATATRLYAISADGILGAAPALDDKFVVQRGTPIADASAITLRALASMTGTVVGEAGTPISDAGIYLLLGGDSQSMLTHPAGIRLTRDGAKLTLSGIPAGVTTQLSIATGNLRAQLDPDPFAPGEMRDLGDIVLHPNGDRGAAPAPVPPQQLTRTIRGTVVDADGNPVPGVTVQTEPPAGSSYNRASDVTDQSGVFILSGLPNNEPSTVTALAAGFKRLQVSVEPSAAIPALRLTSVAAHLIGLPAPELNVGQWISGNPMRLSDLRGKIVLLYVGVDTRGGAFPNNNRELFSLAEKHTNQMEVILVHRSVSPDAIARGRAGRGAGAPQSAPLPMSLPTAIDARYIPVAPDDSPYYGATAKLYGVEAHPISGAAMILVDKKGIVRAVPNAMNLNEWVARLMAE